MTEKKIVFNSSMPRSGSTLLQNILAQNPSIYASSTSGVVAMLYAARTQIVDYAPNRAQDQDTLNAGFQSFCNYAMQGYYAGVTDRSICIDKSRIWLFHYEWLNSFFPNPRIIVCVRDLRAIISSMEKLFRKNRHREINREGFMPKGLQMMTMQARVTTWLGGIPVGLSSTAVIDAVQRGTIKNMHVVRYEDLTTEPKATLKKVYDYLEEPYYEHDFDNVEQLTFEDDSQYAIYGDHNIREKVKPVPPDYWEVLGKDISAGVMRTYPSYFAAFYPEKK